MSQVRRNVVANYLGQGWTALMGLVFVPLYLKYLGMEAYGLIGLFAVLQAWLTLLDMGMTPTLSREMSRFTGGAHTAQSIRDLLRTLETIAIAIALLIALGVWAGSGWLASDWLKADKLPVPSVAQAFAIMGVVTSLRFVEGLYRGAVVGLQRQVLLNVTTALLATLRSFGAVGVLVWISPTIVAYFIWQVAISLITVGTVAVIVYRFLPRAERRPRFSREALSEVWKFASSMMATTLLTLLLCQVDKLILSRLLTLEAFGHYTLAATVAGVLSMMVAPITQAYYPRLTELVTQGKQRELIKLYHHGSQLIGALIGPSAMVLMLFGERLVAIWTGDARLAHSIASLVAIQALGIFLNGVMNMPYILQLAHGWSSFAAKMNVIAVCVVVPAIFWVTPRYGAVGAAAVFALLNCGCIVIAVHFMHGRLIPGEKWRWYVLDLGLPGAVMVSTALILKSVQPAGLQKVQEMAWLVAVGMGITLAALLASTELRLQVLTLARKVRTDLRLGSKCPSDS